MFAAKNELFTRPSGGYQISRSVRLRSSASAYFDRTPATASNRKTWTYSLWVKRGELDTVNQELLNVWSANSDTANLEFRFSSQNLMVNGWNTIWRTTTQVFRDTAAWYHIVLAFDTTQAIANDRIKLYVNGSQITAFSTTNNPALNADTGVNQAVVHNIGREITIPGRYFDGYLTEINFIDGQALTPSSFGQYNANGVWSPIKYAGTYGTNGFYLNFSDNSASTATTIGKDYSGNGNNWTPNNISVTAGVTYDSMLDVPTLYADGGNGRGNYAVANPLLGNNNKITPVNGNLTITLATGTNAPFGSKSTIGVSSAKWYWETTITAKEAAAGSWVGVGVVFDTVNWPSGNFLGANSGGYEYLNDGFKYTAGTQTAYGASYTVGDVIGVALDMDAGTIVFYKNNTSQGTAFTSIGTGIAYPAFDIYRSTGTIQTLNANFGQRPFAYTPPTGFVALNTQNLSTPTIANGAAYMAATTYTGTGASLAIANTVNSASFQPDFVWVKGRSGATDHAWYDSVRGVQKQLESNTSTAETTETTGLTAFGSTGFTVGALAQMNTSAATYVGWQWKAGTTSASNTNGTITSTVSVGATQGFSVVTYTGNGTNGATIGHGLGVAPNMVIVKSRNKAYEWPVYHSSLTSSQTLFLNATYAAATYTNRFNYAGFSSTVFSAGSTGSGAIGEVNELNTTYVAYCFSAVAGYSAFGSYTGNGSTDGPFVYLGFRPRWIMLKESSGTNAATSGWVIQDTSTNTYNQEINAFSANSSSAEVSSSLYGFDGLSNGFKLKSTNQNWNESGGTYIYACFAENPFKYSLAR